MFQVTFFQWETFLKYFFKINKNFQETYEVTSTFDDTRNEEKGEDLSGLEQVA